MIAISRKAVPEIATKLQIGAAACVLAAAAVLTPATVAQAGPGAPVPLASSPGSVGGSGGAGAALIAPDCVPVGSLDCAAISAPSLTASSGGLGSIFQNPLWWFGAANPS